MKENRMIEEFNRHLEEQEKKKQDEWHAKEERIKNIMSRMADTVVK